MKKWITLFFFCTAILATTGCISYGQRLNQSQIASIQRNVTTEAEIRATFGEPVSTRTDMKRGTKVLTYGYRNDDSAKKAAAGAAGAVAGGLLGSQIGGGTGSAIAGGIGALVGGFFANNAVTARNEKQYLEVTISLATHKVIDYNYIETKGRSQKMGFTSGVSPL